jgi:putative zinc finger/helix-turn-helix YgiT family protein
MGQKIKGKQVMADKPYPWTCGRCAHKRVEPVVGDYTVDFKHDGRLHKVVLLQIEIPTCQNCGNVQTGIQLGDKVTKALREKIGLMSPEEIRQQRTALGLNQDQLGECIGAAKESISRWETGALIQSVSTDKLLRMFFKHPIDPVWKNRWTSEQVTSTGSECQDALATWK